jgi:adenylate cyclase
LSSAGGARKLAAILVSDVVGYSRLAGADEDRTLARLRGLRSDLIDPAIAANRGRIVKRTGDGSISRKNERDAPPYRSRLNALRVLTTRSVGAGPASHIPAASVEK